MAAPQDVPGWIAADLAPGDGRSTRLDVSMLTLHVVRSTKEPAFADAYGLLWGEFGASGGLESVETLGRRMRWPLSRQDDGWTLRYELLTTTDPAGNVAAVRDHSVIIAPATPGVLPEVVVHLSHLLVMPAWRRTGLAGWMRALPLQMARAAWQASGAGAGGPRVTLVAEMDPVLPGAPERLGRLLAYGRAGFRVIDPAAVRYFQPDFRPPEAIDTAGGPAPLPMDLVLRRVGRKSERMLDGAEVRGLTGALYRMYGDGCRTRDMVPLIENVQTNYPRAGEIVKLLVPGTPGAPGAPGD